MMKAQYPSAERADVLEKMKAAGVRMVRLQYPDLHGVPRGKIVSVDEFERCTNDGVAFATGVMGMDLRHLTHLTIEEGIPDMHARPDLSTLVQVPWEPQFAWCLCDLEEIQTHKPYLVDPRGTLRRSERSFFEIGYAPLIASEMEFYLMKPDETAQGRYRRYVELYSPVYTFGSQADPLGIVEKMFEYARTMELNAISAFHEYGRGQYEINLFHSTALDSADRAFRFKTLVKEVAVRQGLLATFMGKPWNDDEGSGFHLHISLQTTNGENAFYDPHRADGLSDVALHFVAGLLARMPALMAFLNPTVNAYRRIHMQGLVPTRINWGYDHRFALIRIPPDRGRSTRIEIRIGDGTANPYLAYAAVLWAGLEGIRQKMYPPKPISGLISELPKEEQGPPVPSNLDDALEALEQDAELTERLGEELIRTFLTVKKAEFRRYQQWTSEWELEEYVHRL
ncbi:glutamine synthetase family protein [Kyrpidia spormannii]|uniref:L-glutamine synthetase n=2 Tax=Kyrpidia spormannii TaxID=2055160 RepID=A0ACA8ZBU2_9BACL|nr:glutamine synthetase family protein [Kyrpidia spormannii]CAB3394636.1 L-glutamine synthetase [Kyrpidia spormannii]CAB3395608.1 L-glutamine synthetase [Kyrpidia spormannii]